MQLDVIYTVILIILIIIECTVLAWALFQRSKISSKVLLVTTVLLSIATTILQLIPANWSLLATISREGTTWLLLIGVIATFGGLVLDDIVPEQSVSKTRLGWFATTLIWAIAFFISLWLYEPFIAWGDWTETFPTIPAVIAIFGAGISMFIIVGTSLRYYYIAPMAEVANRSAFWVMTSILFIGSLVLLASGIAIVMLLGTVFLLIALIIASYGMQAYRLVDIRQALVLLARLLSVIAIAWTLIFATLYFFTLSRFAEDLSLNTTTDGTFFLAVIALLIATLIVPARYVIEFIFNRLTIHSRPNLAKATARFSQQVSRASTIEEVVNATTDTLNHALGVQRSALILINNTVRVKDSVELIVLEMGATLNKPTLVGYLHEDSPIYHLLANRGVPIGQYDIDYGTVFKQVSSQEKQFFSDLKMSAFVPVKTDNRLIGLLASGTKTNDTPYHRDDIELLSVVGQQVGTALRSARLIDDLQHLNESMRVLNKRLEGAKSELEKLDDIKTDFITIASHELRTPLAQIRGYTDILDSLNQANALQEGQANTIVGNLRKSTERMEELISAMLDVSQIDVNSMDLHFIRTSPETITKMALEPLRDPADERNITIIRHSAKDLPNIDADLQRMVQAIRNIILNAIKFTPDGGRIEIFSTLEKAQHEHGSDHILFTIQDTGVGIDKKDIEYIFNKFYRAFDTQLHSSGIYKFMGAGPGLGLTIAKGIIEGHGGHIWAESTGHDMKNPPGTTFFIRLPIERPSGTRRVLPFADDMNRTQMPLKPVE